MLIRKYFQKVHLFVKAAFLLIFAFIFFFSLAVIKESALITHFIVMVLLCALLGIICRKLVGKHQFRTTINLWALGSIIYLLIAIPITLKGYSLSPLIKIIANHNRWIFSLGYPLRLLGIFFVGIIFIELTSPIEFLIFNKSGIKIALLFRSVEYGKQTFFETADTLRMQGLWPEENKKIISISDIILMARQSVNLITITFRNILFWFPWAYLCYDKIKKSIKGGGK